MAKKNKDEEVIDVPATRAVALPAEVITQSEKRGKDVDLPDFLKDDDAFTKEAPDGFSPLIDFGDRIGSYIIARFIGLRADIGPNKSIMYDFEVVKPDKSTMQASLWGSTILDTKMYELTRGSDVLKAGDWVFIQYLGTVETQRGMNPAKDFRVKIVNPEKIKGQYWG